MNTKITIFLLVLLSTNRLMAQIIPDSTFSQDGVVKYAPLPQAQNFASKTTVLPNGSMLVAGSSLTEIKVWKYTSTGSLDQSFGTNGVAINTAMTNIKPSEIQDIIVQDDGKIMVLAEHKDINTTTYNNSLSSILLLRFNANGTADNTFNSNGYRKHNPSPAYQYIPLSLAISADKSYYVSSQAIETGNFSCPIGFGKWCISKYNNDGSSDFTFNSSSYKLEGSNKLKANTVTPVAIINDLKVMPDGNLLAAGHLHHFDSAFVNFRLKTNGDFDSTYGTNGINVVSNKNLGFSASMALGYTISKIQSDNSILHYTSFVNYNPDTARVYFMRTDANGLALNTFGNNGVFKTSYQAAVPPMTCVQNNGDIILANYKQNGTDQSINFRHITANGQLNAGLGNNGVLTTQAITNDVYANKSRITDITFSDNENKINFVTFSSTPTYISTHFGAYRYRFTPTPVIGVGLAHNQFDPSISIYPNPFYTSLTIDFKKLPHNALILAKVIDLNGRIIYQKEVTNKQAINISSIANGNYVLELKNGGQAISKLITKK